MYYAPQLRLEASHDEKAMFAHSICGWDKRIRQAKQRTSHVKMLLGIRQAPKVASLSILEVKRPLNFPWKTMYQDSTNVLKALW